MRHDGRVSSQSRLALTRRRVLPEGYGCGSAPHNCGAEKKQHRFALHSTPREFCGVWIRLQKVRQERTHFPRWTGIVTGDSRDLRFEFPGGTDCTSSCVRQDQPRETNSSAMKVFSKSATWSPSWRRNWASTTSPSTRQNQPRPPATGYRRSLTPLSGNGPGVSSALAAAPLIQCERPATGIEFTLQGTAGKLETFPAEYHLRLSELHSG